MADGKVAKSGRLAEVSVLGLAAGGLDTVGHAAQSRGMAKSWLCRIGNHHWLRKEDAQGAQYLECERCGKLSEPEAGPLIGPDGTPLG